MNTGLETPALAVTDPKERIFYVLWFYLYGRVSANTRRESGISGPSNAGFKHPVTIQPEVLK